MRFCPILVSLMAVFFEWSGTLWKPMTKVTGLTTELHKLTYFDAMQSSVIACLSIVRKVHLKTHTHATYQVTPQ